MHIRILLGALAVGMIASPPAIAAQPPEAQRAPVLQRVVNCRAIAATQQRLACYDREVAALDAAETSKELVVMDRQQVRSTRRSLFGLSLPNLGIFGDDNSEADAPSQLDSTIRSASQNANGRWVLTLADGARWTQLDSRTLPVEPRSGHSVKIRRAGLGSYLANVNGQTAIRVRRER